MNLKKTFSNFIIAFCVITSCITLLEGILGCIFLPETTFGFEAYFSPPLFGFLTALTGLIPSSSKEPGIGRILLQKFLQLLVIELIVFGVNAACGTLFAPPLTIALALGIALVFLCVYGILWLNDMQNAQSFNKQLKTFQEEHLL